MGVVTQKTIPESPAKLVLLPAEHARIPQPAPVEYVETGGSGMLHIETTIANCNSIKDDVFVGSHRYLLQMKGLCELVAVGTIFVI